MRTTSDDPRHPVRHATDGHEAAERYQTAEENAASATASATASASTGESELEADIRRRAYERYVARGDAPGSDVEDWCAAEREVREVREARRTTDSSTATGPDGEQVQTPRGHRADELRAAPARREAGRRDTPRSRPA